MNFSYNSEQTMLKEAIRKFVEKEIAPNAAKWETEMHFPKEIMDLFGKQGYLGIPYPEKYNGQGLGYQEYIIVLEEIAKHSAALAIAVAVNGLPQLIIDKFGNDTQKEKYLPKLSTGELTGAFALTEPDYGSDAKNIKSSVKKDGKYYILKGNKRFISQAKVADIFIVLARTDNTGSSRDISAFILEKGTPGFSVGKHERKMGLNSSPTCELYFDDVKIPEENLVGELGMGFKIAMIALDSGRITIGATAVGVAQGALDNAAKYAIERKQFGKSIAEFQGISFMLADMATKVDASRLLVQRAAFLKDKEFPFSKEAAMAKLFSTDTAMSVTTDAVQIFGGNGYMVDYPVERFMREAKVLQIVEGANQIQKIVISRLLVKEYSKLL